MTLNRYYSVMLLIAAGLLAVFFFEIRTPGAVGLLYFVACFVAFIAIFGGGGLALGQWSSWSWRGIFAPLICVGAIILGRELGFVARDGRFVQWRMPIYVQVVDRVKQMTAIPGFDEEAIDVELSPEEKEAAKAAWASLDSNRSLVVSFYWAGNGPPPHHFTYDYVAADAPPEEELPHRVYRRMAPHWFETSD